MNALSWLSRLIAFDTASRYSNLPLIDAVQSWFEQHHIVSRLVHDPKQDKANLFATIPAANGKITGGLILSGHTDVVPVDHQNWETDPFTATEKDHKIYGRGACDMKGFLAVVLSLVPEFQKMKLSKPIHFAFSYDEEIGCCGAPYLVESLLQENIQAEACIIGEPTELYPVIAHKGIQLFRCHIQGLAAHSSLTPQGCNAIDYAAELICYLRSLAEEMKKNGPFDQAFDVPYTSLSTNMINGGIAYNTIPAECELIFEFRQLPNVLVKEINQKINIFIKHKLEPKMQREYRDARITIHSIASVPSFNTQENSDILNITQDLLKTDKTHKVAYTTEAGIFQKANIPTIVCGPGSIQQAHRENEYIELSQLKKCEEFLRDIVVKFNFN